MLACLDVDYRGERARAGCVLFRGWGDAAAARELATELDAPADYVPGELYRRELPCLLAVIGDVEEPLETLVVDGYVWLGAAGERPGLGAHLWLALDRRIPVIGVAKNPFSGASGAIEVRRGDSSRPLYVTAAGAEGAWAAERVAEMHGDFRIPTLLKRVDRLSREWG